MSVKVLVLGHSHVYWLGAFAGSASPSGLFADFAIRGHACDIRYLGLRGATASSLRAPAVRSQIASFGADVVVLHVGGNDWDVKSAPDPCMVACDLQRLASELLAMGVSPVAVCQVVRRQRWRNFSFEEGAARVIALNAELESLCKGVDGMFFGDISVFDTVSGPFSAGMGCILLTLAITVFSGVFGGPL